jgi:hypothetical protein
MTGVLVVLSSEGRNSLLADELVTVQDHAVPPVPLSAEDRENRRQTSGQNGATASTTSSTSASPARRGRPTVTRPRPGAATSSGLRGFVLDGRTMGGWYAGASGTGVADGSFQAWLGQPVTVASVWADTDDEVQRTVSGLSGYESWKGAIDIAVGGTVLGSGENYASAASGAYDARWRAAAKVIAAARKGKGPTFVRPFHEMNGGWYHEWTVTRENSADYKKAFARYASILRAAMPEVYIVFSPNYGDATGLPIDYWYPGDSVVDVVAPDYYNDYNGGAGNSVAAWNAAAGQRDDNGNPQGPEAWRQFAQQHGKPLGFPEWGLKPAGQGGGDTPEWIKAFEAWMNRNANKATWGLGGRIPSSSSGKVLYSCYFNVVHGGDPGFTIYGSGANPRSAAIFPDLTWGNVKIAS